MVVVRTVGGALVVGAIGLSGRFLGSPTYEFEYY